MRKLVLAPAGKWQRGSGEVVTISLMADPHLYNALRIVDAKHNEVTASLARGRELQAKWKTQDTEMGRRALAEMEALLGAVAAKRDELQAEIDRRRGVAVP